MHVDESSGVDFRDDSTIPDMEPPSAFKWQFLVGVRALVPILPPAEVDNGANALKVLEGDDTQSAQLVSHDTDLDSDDSMSEFERNLKELMPDLHSGIETRTKGTRKSERPKRPSSRFNEEAGFLAKPPK